MKRYGIVGAGISGLCLAFRIFSQSQKLGKAVIVQIYECSSNIGGRVLTKQIQVNGSISSFDIGANLIDFENVQSQNYWNDFMPQKIKSRLQLMKKPFLIYENGKLREGDYQKKRYFYKQGFSGLIKDLCSQLKSSNINIYSDHKVLSLNYKDSQVGLRIKNSRQGHQLEEKFDKVYFSCPPPSTSLILRNSLQYCKSQIKEQLISFLQQCEETRYTKQISVAFKNKTIDHNFSCILFKNHKVISFICSHLEKYQQSSIVVQICEQFSQQHFKQSQQTIGKRVYESLPEQIQEITEPKPLYIHRWPVSLLKKGKKIVYNEEKLKIGVVGDSLLGKSRVTGAVLSTSAQFCRL